MGSLYILHYIFIFQTFKSHYFIFNFQVLSEEISAKERIVEETELEIDAARGAYQPVATHASVLFFCVSDLAAVEPMYQFSLGWFIALYLQVCCSSSCHHLFFLHPFYFHVAAPMTLIPTSFSQSVLLQL